MTSHVQPGGCLGEVAALPVRLHPLGVLEVLLVRSADTGRWIIPIAGRTAGLDPAEAAALVARQVARVVGEVAAEPFGHFEYQRRLSSGLVLTCSVAVHVMQVTGPGVAADGETLMWLRSREAAKQVCNMSLQRIIARVGRSIDIRRLARAHRESEWHIPAGSPSLA